MKLLKGTTGSRAGSLLKNSETTQSCLLIFLRSLLVGLNVYNKTSQKNTDTFSNEILPKAIDCER